MKIFMFPVAEDKGYLNIWTSVFLSAPSGREIPFRLEYVKHGKYQVEYITAEVGEHTIDLSVAGKPLIGSPFHCFAYDPSQIKVGKIPNGTVGKPVEFESKLSLIKGLL